MSGTTNVSQVSDTLCSAEVVMKAVVEGTSMFDLLLDFLDSDAQS